MVGQQTRTLLPGDLHLPQRVRLKLDSFSFALVSIWRRFRMGPASKFVAMR
jgi:hypothetical protein